MSSDSEVMINARVNITDGQVGSTGRFSRLPSPTGNGLHPPDIWETYGEDFRHHAHSGGILENSDSETIRDVVINIPPSLRC